MVRVGTIAWWSALVIGAGGCGSPDYATWVGRADTTTNGSPAAPVSGEPALIAYWRFDDGSGTVVSDSLGRGHDGTILGSADPPNPVWTTGKIGRALAFDGRTFVRVPYSSDWDKLGSTHAFTVVAWVVRQTFVTGWNTVVSRQYQATQWEHFNLGFRDDRVVPVVSTQVNELWYCTAPASSVDGLWTHIASTYDGGTLRAYQNGVEICSLDFSAMFPTDVTGIIIGAETNTATTEQFFTGLVDEVALYGRALGASEIADLAGGKPIAP